MDTSGGDNCRFRLDHIENEWYGIKHIKVDGTDRFADVDGKSKNNGAVLHLWESSDSKVKGNNHRQFAFYYIGNDANGNARYYIKNRNSGKWIGYEGKLNNNNPKIIQTDEKNRKVWLITKSVVPFTGKESQVLHKDDKTAVCEIHKAGELAALNRMADSLVPGALPHFYTMGTTSKWKLTWVKDYNAYQIESISEGEKDTGLALDVQSESGRMNTTINLWVEEEFDHNQNTSQLWRFFKQSDGTYLIQNARSGLYILETVNGLKLGEQGTKIDLSILAGNTEKTKYYYAENWMANIPDDALLSSVNIPATHDTGSAVLAVPANDDDFIYISSGTWSLMGIERKEADCSEKSCEMNFTNEGGYAGRFRYLKNIMGLWMIQSVRHEVNDAYSFAEICAMAEEAKDFPSRVDANDECFLSPDNMTEEVKDYCRRTGQKVPELSLIHI